MDSNKTKVMEWINQHFKVENFTLIDFPFLPGGTILRDKQGAQLLVYYDFLRSQIKYE
jgi:hypothetical protein